MRDHDETRPAPRAEADESASAEARFGDFIIEKRLGVGGMGAVYLARRASDGLAVALKVLNPVAGADEGLVKRFVREAQCLLTLDHLNIVKAFDLGSENGQHFICMEYVRGENLGTIIEREGRVEPETALMIMKQVAGALSYGWKHGVVHRDLKPENILLNTDGVCKLADMGLAVLANREDLRLTAPGTVMGTPDYMSPEQARAVHDIDTRSDVYSLGCTIYHAVCGRRPFEGPSVVEILKKHLSEAPRAPREIVPGLSRGAEQILLKCMAKEPVDRFQTCAELVEAIDRERASAAPEGGPASDASARAGASRDTSRRQAFEDASPEPPAPSDAPDAPEAPDAAALLIAHARASAPASPGGGPRPHPAADPGARGRMERRPTHATIHVPKRRGAMLPTVLLGVVVAAIVLAIVSGVLYLFFTTPG